MINFDPIETNIIIGSAPTTLIDVQRLAQQLKVTAVINLQSSQDFAQRQIDWPALQAEYQKQDVSVHHFPINDFDESDLGAKVGEPIQMLHRLLAVGHRVYVHCNAGICRASATVMGYLCVYRDMDETAALNYLRERRPQVNPYRKAVRQAVTALQEKA